MQVNKALLALAMGMAMAACGSRGCWRVMRHRKHNKLVCRYFWP